jgi:N-acetylglutamate synthase-like GNAT family acetyltransferase
MEDTLKFIRVFSPYHVPKKYIDQLKGVDFTAENFYRYLERHCTIQTTQGPTLNPLVHLYVLTNEENVVKGFLYFVVDELTKDIVIQNYSVDPMYWSKGQIIELMKDHVLLIHEKAKLNKVFWITRSPSHSEKYGFKRSKECLMEYDPNKRLEVKPLEEEKVKEESKDIPVKKKPAKKAKKAKIAKKD